MMLIDVIGNLFGGPSPPCFQQNLRILLDLIFVVQRALNEGRRQGGDDRINTKERAIFRCEIGRTDPLNDFKRIVPIKQKRAVRFWLFRLLVSDTIRSMHTARLS